MPGTRTLFALFVMFCVAIPACAPAGANIASMPVGGIAAEGNQATYLKNAQIFINVGDESGNGTGLYMIHNPSNDTENLVICFYSGSIASDVSIAVNGYQVPTENGGVANYWGPVFDVMVPADSFSNISVTWKFDFVEGSGLQYSSTTRWIARYLIIGTAGWNHTIDDVDITFRLKNQHFRNFEANFLYTTATCDDAKAINAQFSDFDYRELELTVMGDSITRYYILDYVIIPICIFIAIACVAFYLWKRRRMKSA